VDFGAILKKERINKELSIQELAEKAGVTVRAIYYWERGEKHMSIESADKVFNALGVSVTIGKK
jgi:DNA-binding helix-turn-helix protein